MESRRRILLNTPHIKSLSGNALSFKTDVPFEMKECKIHFTPKQEGTGTPSPDNVRPITGWDGVSLTLRGKNLVNVEHMKSTYPWTNTVYKGYALFVGANKTVTLSCAKSLATGYDFHVNVGVTSAERNESNLDASRWMYHKTVPQRIRTKLTVTADSAGYIYINVYVRNSDALNRFYTLFLNNDFQVEYGSEKTSYEPYVEPQTLTIPFPQTIFGGYVDLVKGEVVEEWGNIASYNGESVPDGWMSDRGELITGAQVTYPLAIPNTYPLTDPPSIPSTLRGMNNITTTANGEISVSFYSH